MLDIRLPIGLMFAIIGVMLAGFGLFSDKQLYERSLGINVNLWWGLAMFAFGAIMFILGRRGTSSARPADDTVEGRRMEEREQQIGLEQNRPRRGH
jgi:hypothetical protein